MNADNEDHTNSRILKIIFKEHLDNTIECGKALSELFLNLEEPDQYISKVKHLEEKGDRLTAEAYYGLELLTYSEFIYIAEQLVKRLDDITDGMNNTARLIDRGICAVTLSGFTGEKGADISPQNNFLDYSLTPHLTTLGAKYPKNSSAPVFRR